MTMLNQLEKIDDSFFRVVGILPASIGLRFHKDTLENLAASGDRFFKAVADLEPKAFQGIYRLSLLSLADKLNCKPYNVPKLLYSI